MMVEYGIDGSLWRDCNPVISFWNIQNYIAVVKTEPSLPSIPRCCFDCGIYEPPQRVWKLEEHHLSYLPQIIILLCHKCHHKPKHQAETHHYHAKIFHSLKGWMGGDKAWYDDKRHQGGTKGRYMTDLEKKMLKEMKKFKIYLIRSDIMKIDIEDKDEPFNAFAGGIRRAR